MAAQLAGRSPDDGEKKRHDQRRDLDRGRLLGTVILERLLAGPIGLGRLFRLLQLLQGDRRRPLLRAPRRHPDLDPGLA